MQTGRRGVWAAGLGVAAGAGVATAHGLYQVAAASRVPTPIAWLYPVITDGLALVAYAATSRLTDGGRRYAATIVVLAAGLSGLAQAVYLAGGIAESTTAPVGLRFGVGAWPAAAAALTAHLLHLVSGSHVVDGRRRLDTYASTGVIRGGVRPGRRSTVQSADRSAVQPDPRAGVQPRGCTAAPYNHRTGRPRCTAALFNDTRTNAGRRGDFRAVRVRGGAAPARDRARQAARSHYARHSCLPTATELMELAQVARGTAGTVLKDLRDNRPALHIVNATTDEDTNQ